MLSADQGTAPFSLSPTLSPSSSSRPVKCFACGQIFAARCGYSFSLCTVSSFSSSFSNCCCSSGRDFGHAACRRPFSRFSCVFFLLFFSCFSFCFSSILLFFSQLAPSKPKLRGSAAFRVIKKCGQLCPQPRHRPCCAPIWALASLHSFVRLHETEGVGGHCGGRRREAWHCVCCGPFLLMLA